MDIIIDYFLTFAGLMLGFIGGYYLLRMVEKINEETNRTNKEN